MSQAIERHVDQALTCLEEHGLLIQADNHLPSVVTLVTGEPVRGSWWSHQRAHEIYAVCVALNRHPDILEVKLIGRKVTLVHRDLWSHLSAIGAAMESWQTRDLADPACRLLESVRRRKQIRTDHYRKRAKEPRQVGSATRRLEERLLIISDEIHTESGAHAKVLETWDHWQVRTGYRTVPMGLTQAKTEFRNRLMNLRADEPDRLLPWPATGDLL